jgi:large subunit ribosomal protein L19
MSVITAVENKFKKHHVVDARSGDSVRVHQKIREGNKERIQIFEGLVIRTKRSKSHTATITVRRVASGIGVEKTYLLHSPLITKIEVVKRSKVRRNYLSYMRDRRGKAARLTGVDFDKEAVNKVPDEPKKDEPKAESDASTEPAENQKTEEAPAEKPESKSDEKTEAIKEGDSDKESPSK